jgi:hypothetical protein
MRELVRRSGYAPAGYGDHWPSRSEERAISEIEGRGMLQRRQDIEAGRRTANRVDVVAALAGHTMERAEGLIRYRRDLAAGDPDIELGLLPFQQAAFRKMLSLNHNLYGPLG